MARYSRKKISELLAESDNAPTNDEKGAKLEELTRYVFERVRGVSFHDKNILDGNRAHELDVVFWSPQNLSDLCFLDAVLITECKNTGVPVGGHAVGWFVRKLQDRGVSCGVLISLNGITGAVDGISSAHSEVLSALVRDGIRVLIVTRDEIERLRTSGDLVLLLRGKFLKLTLQKTVVIDETE